MKSLLASVAALSVFVVYEFVEWKGVLHRTEPRPVQHQQRMHPSIRAGVSPTEIHVMAGTSSILHAGDSATAKTAATDADDGRTGRKKDDGRVEDRDGIGKGDIREGDVEDGGSAGARDRNDGTDGQDKDTDKDGKDKDTDKDGKDKDKNGNAECIPVRPVRWHWDLFSRPNYGTNATAATTTPYEPAKRVRKQKNVLIAAFAGFDRYASMLEMTAPVNKAYARKWKQDFVVLQGTSYTLPVDAECTPQGRRTTLNKISLLRKALQKNDKYDMILILDTDAMLYDLDVDISTVLPDRYMVAAHRVKVLQERNTHTADINAGVTLWNLKHKSTPRIAQGWHDRSTAMINANDFRGDQVPLQRTLREEDGVKHVYSLVEEFAYGHGTVIKHFIRRRGHRDWTDPTIVDDREHMIDEAVRKVCASEPGVCDGIDRVPYASL